LSEASAAAVQPGTVAQPVVAAVPTPVANGLSTADLQPMLESAGLVWVNTDADKLRAAQQAASAAAQTPRVPRERKTLPPLDTTPMQQVETRKAE
jgi:ribonuclease E